MAFSAVRDGFALLLSAFALLSWTGEINAGTSRYSGKYVKLINGGQQQWQAGENLEAKEAIAYQNLHLSKAGQDLIEYDSNAAEGLQSRGFFRNIRCFFGLLCKKKKKKHHKHKHINIHINVAHRPGITHTLQQSDINVHHQSANFNLQQQSEINAQQQSTNFNLQHQSDVNIQHQSDINVQHQPGSINIHESDINALLQPANINIQQSDINTQQQPANVNIQQPDINIQQQPANINIQQPDVNIQQQPDINIQQEPANINIQQEPANINIQQQPDISTQQQAQNINLQPPDINIQQQVPNLNIQKLPDINLVHQPPGIDMQNQPGIIVQRPQTIYIQQLPSAIHVLQQPLLSGVHLVQQQLLQTGQLQHQVQQVHQVHQVQQVQQGQQPDVEKPLPEPLHPPQMARPELRSGAVLSRSAATPEPEDEEPASEAEFDFDSIEEDSPDPNAPGVEDIPAEFDARSKWKRCAKGIADPVRSPFDNCLADHVTSVISALQDRWCIQNKTRLQFSAARILTCNENGGYCKDGSAKFTYKYFRDTGVVTGRQVEDLGTASKTEDGCVPYGVGSAKEANFTVPDTSTCKSAQCTNAGYKKAYSSDLTFIKKFYRVEPEPRVVETGGFLGYSANGIKLDILTYGPVTATMQFYEDILFYKKGVYKPIPEAQRIGEITLKIFGWGVEKEVEYWLATNIWKKDFGDGGIIKIEAFNPKLKLESGIIGGRFEGVPFTGSKDDQGARSVNPSSGNKDCC
nr:PREDICTED: uncharacterized protein LOC109037264 isoform X1 [Bemisia tabaci]XP_018907398.1 PREDICTED: uncharacterized protein LOC109037264 isoform X2 [Bemisia tabaci]